VPAPRRENIIGGTWFCALPAHGWLYWRSGKVVCKLRHLGLAIEQLQFNQKMYLSLVENLYRPLFMYWNGSTDFCPVMPFSAPPPLCLPTSLYSCSFLSLPLPLFPDD
jgi:hypothetical protein